MVIETTRPESARFVLEVMTDEPTLVVHGNVRDAAAVNSLIHGELCTQVDSGVAHRMAAATACARVANCVVSSAEGRSFAVP